MTLHVCAQAILKNENSYKLFCGLENITTPSLLNFQTVLESFHITIKVLSLSVICHQYDIPLVLLDHSPK